MLLLLQVARRLEQLSLLEVLGLLELLQIQRNIGRLEVLAQLLHHLMLRLHLPRQLLDGCHLRKVLHQLW